MYQRILLALDLEGVNMVVGDPYSGLVKGCEQWEIARRQAVLEINAAADALFAAGAKRVDLWDNHGSNHNIDASLVDTRVRVINADRAMPRMSFAQGMYDCICYFGYHAMEGTLGGVLAHTWSSKSVQYCKLNGSYVGEIDMDAYIAASHGMPSCFFAAGDIACAQARREHPEIVTVTTKQELSRNEAIFRENEELLFDIREKIVEAVKAEHPIRNLSYPAVFEKSYKRVEDAAKFLARMRERGMDADYPDDTILGKDAHTVVVTVHNIDEFTVCM